MTFSARSIEGIQKVDSDHSRAKASSIKATSPTSTLHPRAVRRYSHTTSVCRRQASEFSHQPPATPLNNNPPCHRARHTPCPSLHIPTPPTGRARPASDEQGDHASPVTGLQSALQRSNGRSRSRSGVCVKLARMQGMRLGREPCRWLALVSPCASTRIPTHGEFDCELQCAVLPRTSSRSARRTRRS